VDPVPVEPGASPTSGRLDSIAPQDLRTGVQLGSRRTLGSTGGLLVVRSRMPCGLPEESVLPRAGAPPTCLPGRAPARHDGHGDRPPPPHASACALPNSAVRAQWLRTVELFGASDGVARTRSRRPYRLPDLSVALPDPGSGHGIGERRRATLHRRPCPGFGCPACRAATWRGEAAERRLREIARIKAAIKREIALGGGWRRWVSSGEDPGAGRVPSPPFRGYVVRKVPALLGDIHLVGLATPSALQVCGRAMIRTCGWPSAW
jgi:hypothetical protein